MWQQMPTDGSCRSGEGHRITSNPVNRVIRRACHLVKITANYPFASPDCPHEICGGRCSPPAPQCALAPFSELFSSVACRRTACNFTQQRVNSAANGCTVLPTFYCHCSSSIVWKFISSHIILYYSSWYTRCELRYRIILYLWISPLTWRQN